jgi:hypothetical protein
LDASNCPFYESHEHTLEVPNTISPIELIPDHHMTPYVIPTLLCIRSDILAAQTWQSSMNLCYNCSYAALLQSAVAKLDIDEFI